MNTPHHYILLFILIVGCYFRIGSTAQVRCNASDGPQVALSTGCVEGLKFTSALGRPLYSFRGIPYAAPPLGHLRFRAPQRPIAWSGVLRAVDEPPACIQPWRENPFPITFSEDCLHLNVYTPYLQHPSGKPMPVFVWFHGGKFYQGSGSTYKYGPDFLLSKDIIMVMVNYRLGIFGYLNMNIPGAQGNAALKDKVAALRWVQQEISRFGGDPGSVTIAGDSSGAGAVSYLYISPLSKGLFTRAVSQSGVSLCEWGFLPSNAKLGMKVAHSLGCPTHSAHAAVSCLRDVESTELAERQMVVQWTEGLKLPFVPSLENDLGEEVFLPDTPERLLATAGGVPYLLGTSGGEGLMYIHNPRTDPNQIRRLEENLVSYLPFKIQTSQSMNVLRSITSRVEDFYIGHNKTIQDTMYGFADLLTDVKFSYYIIKTAQEVSVRAPVYLYYFIFEGEFQSKNHSYFVLNLTGVCHGEELGYLFYRNYSIKEHNNLFTHPRDMALVHKMVTLWTNFAIYGNPTPKQHEMNISWKAVKGNFTQHLIIGDAMVMAQYPLLGERVAFWDSIYSNLQTTLSSLSGKINYTTTFTVAIMITSIFLCVAHFFRARRHEDYSTLL